MLATTGHDRFARQDFARLQALGVRTVRDGLRWHLIERKPGRYDFSSAASIVQAARETGTQVIYDLAHYGWPDDIDLFKPDFVTRFGAYARAAAEFLSNAADDVPFLVPVNEISFWSWAAGDAQHLYPFATGRGPELKRQLVRAALQGIEAIWSVNPKARIVHVDPVIHIVADERRPQERNAAEARRLSMYEAWDMLGGRVAPELGGAEKYLDIIGVNFYPHNQWTFADNETLPREHPRYRPFREFLREVWERYHRPTFISETGGIRDTRATWLSYVGDEVRAAMRNGIPIEGICLYPLVNYPGWDSDVPVEHGLWDYPDETGNRPVCEPLERELRRQVALMEQFMIQT